MALIGKALSVKDLQVLFHTPIPRCSHCWKPEAWCICDELSPFTTQKQILILQHPSEAKDPKGSARLLSLSISNSVHKVGLSLKSLSHALGYHADPRQWAVLYVGTKKAGLESKLPDYRKAQGIVLLDGTWKQSKTLWWRNPWLLKLKRVVLNPTEPSSYRQFRRSPRKIYLSTIEAAAEALVLLGESEKVRQNLQDHLNVFLERLSSTVDPPPTSP